MEVRVRGDYSYGYVSVQYDSSLTATYTYTTVTKHAPGVHVSEVISHDPVANISTHKYYKYTSIDNLSGTSGLGVYAINYNSKAYTISMACGSIWGNDRLCVADVISSNSNASQYFYDNNAYVFASVLESDDPDFKRGVIEHKYAAESFVYSQTIAGDEIFQMPTNTNSCYQGAELATNIYDSSLHLVKSVDNYFHVDTAGRKTRTGIVIRPKYDWPLVSCCTVGSKDVYPYDIGVYLYESSWIQQDSTVTKEYDAFSHVLISKSTNFYGNPVNTLPIRTETQDSKGLVLKQENKYPTDSSGIAPYQRMVSKNIISPVIETKSYRNNILLYTTKNNYYDFSESTSSGYPVIIEPKTIQIQKGSGTLDTRIRFYKYDTKGNAIELAKENDIKTVYIWDYNRDYPIAEIKNADSSSVAYTSFEADGKGGWTFSGSPTLHPTATTGSKGYSMAGGNITKSGLSSGVTYTISYWKKDSSSTITVNSGSGTLITTKNGWKLYSHEITGSTSITITGTAYIDELRLYPRSALMTSFTYQPLVGVSSQSDINSRLSYYEYDALGRLVFIRDEDRNILKSICYNYAGQLSECGLYRNVTKSGSFTRNNCSNGYTGSSVTYTVPEATYSSFVSRAYADSLAQADVNANGQTYANANGTCTAASTVYARFEYTDWYYDIDQTYATVLIKFYSNVGCTTPVSVSSLSVNYDKIKNLCVGGTQTTSSSISCTGTQQSLGTQMIMWDDGGSHCWDYVWLVTSGSGYVPAD
ncbi:MAG: DUF5977 domain-containing protein [Bacteroidota bacterium]